MVAIAALSGRMALVPSAAIQEAQPIVRYPLISDLNDATATHAGLIAKGAVLQTGRGLFCSGDYIIDWPDGCDVRTPMLSGAILRGVTRDSLLRLAPDLGYPVDWGYPSPPDQPRSPDPPP